MEDPQAVPPAPGDIPPDAGPAIGWDESNARTISPKTCTVSATREEFALLFGTERSSGLDGREETVRVTDRIVMSPLLVKRVAAQLNEVLRQYELRFGALDLMPPPVRSIAYAASQPGRPSPLPPVHLPDKGRTLFDLVTALDVRTAFEHSFKVCTGRLLEDRFLMAVGRKGVDDPVDEKVRGVCRHLNMPANFARAFHRLLPDANHIYFGFEEEGDTSVFKVYLEFRDRAEEKIQAGVPPLTPFLLHLGFKWDASDNSRKAMTRYEWYPSLPARDILTRLPSMLLRRPGHDPLAVAEAIIGLAAERLDSRDIQYVEASEKGNPRKSFDINMYKANVSLLELRPFLVRLADYYDLDWHEFRLFCERIGSKRFGHLAGGTDREGRDFMTVYYGVEYIQPYARGF